MALSNCVSIFRSFQCRQGPDFSRRIPRPEIPASSAAGSTCKANSICRGLSVYGLSSSLIFKFPPNFERQLRTEARRNRSNIGVAEVAASTGPTEQPEEEEPSQFAPVNLGSLLTGDSSIAIHAGRDVSISISGLFWNLHVCVLDYFLYFIHYKHASMNFMFDRACVFLSFHFINVFVHPHSSFPN